MTEESDFVDSEPFCVHYSDPSECGEKCANCGHTCAQHGGGYSGDECNVAGCACAEFKDSQS